jgi:ABC-type sugar transport system substrate-binding protein
MKKTIGVVLAIALILTLAACSKGTAGTGGAVSPSAAASAEASAAASPSAVASPSTAAAPSTAGTQEKTEVGFFDKNTDYSKNPRYKVVYMVQGVNVLNQGFSDAFKLWADRTNCEYTFWSANNDSDLFVTTILTLKDQGISGVILDPDSTINERVIEVANEAQLPYMAGMSALRDTSGKLVGPFVGFDFPMFGTLMAEWLIDYAKKTWNLTDFSKVAFVGVTMSTIPQLNDRVPAEKDVWLKNFPDLEKNFMIADCVITGKLDADTTYNLISPMMAKNAQYDYWLIAGSQDDWCDGAARAAESMGKADKSVVITMGGTGLIAHWDANEDSCWKAAIFTAQPVYSEPIFMALYAFMNGDATPESIWPEWVDHSKGEKYASMLMTSYTLTKDNYKEYMEWVDKYTGANLSPYDKEYKDTDFDPKGTPPASFAG